MLLQNKHFMNTIIGGSQFRESPIFSQKNFSTLNPCEYQNKVVYLQTKCFKRTIMEIMNNDFWKKREAAMKRFMAAKERKRQRMAELEALLRQDYIERTGEEPKFVNVW